LKNILIDDMRIAILGIKTYPAFAGADRVVENLINNFSNSNEYYIYLSSIDNIKHLECSKNLHFIYIPTVESKHLKAFIYFLFSSLHLFIKGKYDIAHVHNSDFGLFNLILKLKPKLKVLSTFHGNPYQRNKWSSFAKFYLKISEFFFIRFSDHLTTVAESKLNEMPSKYLTKVTYIPNGIQIGEQKLEKVTLPQEIQNNINKYILFACGRLDSTKGLHHLINAFNSIETDLKLVIIGDFNHDLQYSSIIFNSINLNQNIIVFNRLFDKNTLNLIIASSFMFVFPSEIEAMSMMLLEVIAQETRLICSNIPENIAVVGHDYPYLFTNKNSFDLSQKILNMIDDPQTTRLKQKLYEKIITEFNWEKISKQYEKLYSLIKTEKQ